MIVEPFEIYDLEGFTTGRLGVCRQPGQSGDLVADMALIADWLPSVVVTMTTEAEFPAPPLSLPQAFASAEFDWLHLPIADFGTPSALDKNLFDQNLALLGKILSADGRVLIHCKGGQGRSGMLAMRLLVNQGEVPAHALKRLRAVRPHAVETDQQFIWASNEA